VRAGIDLGRPWRNLGEFRIGAQWLRYRSEADSVGAEVVERFQPQDFTEVGLGVRLVVDQLDYAYFPTAGYRVVGTLFGGRRDGADRRDEYTRGEMEGLGVATFGRHTFDLLAVLEGTNDTGLDIVGRYTLGGFHRLSGYRKDQLSGNAVALLRLGWRTPISGEVPFARALTVGATLEAGNAWPRTGAASWSDLRMGSSLYVGSDTGLGPVYLGLTYAPEGSLGLWFVVGRP
jgi:NTE family protein